MGNIVNSLLGASYNEGKITFVLRALYEARDRYVQYQAMIDKNIQESWAKRKEEDKCQRLKCRKRRKDKDNWIQCSRCRVASYCSKKCAKYDWKYGNHKQYCMQYVELTNRTINDFL